MACQIPATWHLLVTSLIKIGARRFDRSFLWTQRKLISEHLTVFDLTLSVMGTPEMKATSFLDADARIPTSHSLRQPGDLSALGK